jgi:hypothetical protein
MTSWTTAQDGDNSYKVNGIDEGDNADGDGAEDLNEETTDSTDNEDGPTDDIVDDTVPSVLADIIEPIPAQTASP